MYCLDRLSGAFIFAPFPTPPPGGKRLKSIFDFLPENSYVITRAALAGYARSVLHGVRGYGLKVRRAFPKRYFLFILRFPDDSRCGNKEHAPRPVIDTKAIPEHVYYSAPIREKFRRFGGIVLLIGPLFRCRFSLRAWCEPIRRQYLPSLILFAKICDMRPGFFCMESR